MKSASSTSVVYLVGTLVTQATTLVLAMACLPRSAHAGGTHACCLTDGSCINANGCGDCLSPIHSGVACFDDVTCDPNPCPQPGACCLDDGSCSQETQPTCSGTFRGEGVTCDNVDCASPIGVCCDGGCDVTALEDCAGVWLGENFDCASGACTAPPNDTCESATSLTLGVSVLGENTAAADDVTTTCDPDGDSIDTPNQAIWFSIVGTGETLTVTTCHPGTSFDTMVQVFCTCGASEPCVVGNDDSDDPGCDLPSGDFYRSKASWCSEAGVTYYIAVGGYSDGAEYTGAIEISVESDGSTCDADPSCLPPDNDTCATAEVLDVGASVLADNGSAQTDESGDCGTEQPYYGMWYAVEGTGDEMTVSTCSDAREFDTKIQVFCDCSPLTCVDGNDDFCGLGSEVSWCSELGKTYYIHIGGYDEVEFGVFELFVTSVPNGCVEPAPCSVSGACCDRSLDLCYDSYQPDCADQAGFVAGTTCAEASCVVGACCLDGNCEEIPESACAGSFRGEDSSCDSAECDQFGACCHDGKGLGCLEVTLAECPTLPNGQFQGVGTTCSLDLCSVPTGACCYSNIDFQVTAGRPERFCTELSEADCENLAESEYRGDGTICDDVSCEVPVGACCLAAGARVAGIQLNDFCEDLPADLCDEFGGIFRGEGSACSLGACAGACCVENDPGLLAGTANCVNAPEPTCDRLGGEFRGLGTSCEIDGCPLPRVSATQKGSLVMFSKVELAWLPAAGGGWTLSQDTFLELSNDYPAPVDVQLYFVNGDAPLDPIFAGDPPMLVVDGEPGWNWVDCQLKLTQDQPTYWSAATGLPAGCQPFTVLDPDAGSGPGRPDVENPGRRVLRGFIYAWAVDANGSELSWNHLSGSATVISYADQSAWEYEAWGFQARIPHGAQTEAPGLLLLNGVDYDMAFDMLLLDFFASGSQALSANGTVITAETDLTLHVVSADLRQDSLGPITTKAEFAIWNENEIRFSGTTRCITCWDQTLLSNYATPNHFLLGNLQTNRGKARINGVASDACDVNCFQSRHNSDLGTTAGIFDFDVVCSQNAAILGLSAKVLAFSGTATGRTHAGGTLIGQGQEPAVIAYDIIDPPGTLKHGARKPRDRGR